MKIDTALLDANVLYPAPLRDLFMQLAVADVFHARWTADIHREWMEALLRNEPYRDRVKLERTRELMDSHTRDCLIHDYEALIPSLHLPDPDDRHVLAAAITGHCGVIVTQNLRDFPEEAVKAHGIAVQHPDEFLLARLRMTQGAFCAAVQRVRRRLCNPSYTADQYLAILTANGLPMTAAALRALIDQL